MSAGACKAALCIGDPSTRPARRWARTVANIIVSGESDESQNAQILEYFTECFNPEKDRLDAKMAEIKRQCRRLDEEMKRETARILGI